MKVDSALIDKVWGPYRRVSTEEEALGVAHLREQLSGVPFYAERAAKCKAATGTDVGYWRDLFSSGVNTARIVRR